MKRFLFMLLTVVFTIGGTVTVFAMDYPGELPELPQVDGKVANIVYTDGYTTYLILMHGATSGNYTVLFKDSESNSNPRLDLSADENYLYDWYKVEDNKWVLRNNYNPGAGEVMDFGLGYGAQFIWSDIDIYDKETGELVFPLPPVPLAEEIREVAEEVLTVETMPELTRTVLVVVLCGVGCLALAISLPLLKKVFSQFQA